MLRSQEFREKFTHNLLTVRCAWGLLSTTLTTADANMTERKGLLCEVSHGL